MRTYEEEQQNIVNKFTTDMDCDAYRDCSQKHKNNSDLDVVCRQRLHFRLWVESERALGAAGVWVVGCAVAGNGLAWRGRGHCGLWGKEKGRDEEADGQKNQEIWVDPW
ncbi:hypothetical protein A0H81_14284 [Grifola frondosa]|uniref:Uncharacterized protein n=1 Tax=Grifola frondosa TaxID=5627 RepID=A0A1C7LLS2_GRIFR|nr:hypothetical protein A0H81_14284 [Grifola frondosa]